MPENAPISPYDTYTSPLSTRNASPEMCRLWSPRHKFQTWRKIWLAVAEAQHEVTSGWAGTSGTGSSGPLVTKEQIEELRANLEVTDDDMRLAEKYEAELRHDVMAHVHAWGDKCPKARPIIHLGMTSQDVVCNADILLLREAIGMIENKLARAIVSFGQKGKVWAKTPTLGFTHYQVAQPVTVGRRCCNWASDLQATMLGIEWNFSDFIRNVARMRGLRGATGTQASFLALFAGDHAMVDRFEVLAVLKMGCRLLKEEIGDLDEANIDKTRRANVELSYREAKRAEANGEHKVAEGWRIGVMQLVDMPIDQLVADRVNTALWYLRDIVGQTYPRVVDAQVLSSLASIAAVLHKIATDIRLLSNRKEIDEPFGKNQIGSSAMPYKRNPMKCERICGLTRFVMNLVGNAYDTAATQWLERTLDDSSNRRLSLPEAFLALDGALDLMHQVASGLVVHEAMVRKNLMAELPFLATENILMEAVKLGGDRQDLHEKIRVHAQAAGMRVKQEGLDNDLIERLRKDPAFKGVHHLLTEDQLLDPMKYIGRSVEQTERFLREVVEPLRERYGEELEKLGSSDRGV